MTIRAFQEEIKDRLNAAEWLTNGGALAIAEDSLDVMNEVTRQMAVVGGVAVVVTTPHFKRNGCGDGLPVEGRLDVKCMELPALNRKRSHLTALDAAEIVARVLDGGNIAFDEISQTADERSGTVTATVSLLAAIDLRD